MSPARHLAAFGVLLGLVIATPPGSSRAAPPDDGLDVQLFRPGAGASDYLHLTGGFMGRHLGFTGGVLFDHASGLLVVDREGDGQRNVILESQDTLNLTLAFTAFERLELGVAVPLVLSQQTGDAFAIVAPGVTAPDGFALGDIRITPKVKIIGVGRMFALGIAAPMSVPSGGSFAGYGGFSVEPKLLLDFNPAYYFRLTLNVGGRFRGEKAFDGLALGKELTWGAGLKISFFIADQLFSILGSFSGSFELPEQKKEDPPVEFLGGLEWRGVRDLSVFIAGGAGFTNGYGAPDGRVVAGVRYGGYRDCPYGEEDLDGWEDDDACADLDNDADGIADARDECPNEPETPNHYEDGDGCPDVMIAYARKLGVEDPEAGTRDTDGDGLADLNDHCPDQPEDIDVFQDGDGCPDPDNDSDGILDIADKCGSQAEVINAFQDDDGCPDVPTGNVRIDDLNKQITITDVIYFETGKAVIQERSFPLLDAITALIEARKDILRLRIEGHTDNIGPADFNMKLSADRAASVATYLAGKGIAAGRLEAVGRGEEDPIADNNTPKGRSENRRVEFEISDYGQPDGQPLPPTLPVP